METTQATQTVENEKELLKRNQCSAVELKAKCGKIDICKNPHNGKLFFACGSHVGYCSKAVIKAHLAGTLTAEQMNYSECSTDNGTTWVPCLSMRSSKNVVGTY